VIGVSVQPDLAAATRRFDWHLCIALAVATLVLIPRGMAIVTAHSPCVDDNYHLYRGLLFLRHEQALLHDAQLNDPPLGEGVLAVPAWLGGQRMRNPARGIDRFSDKPPPPLACYLLPDALRRQTAVWKSILFLPVVAVIFLWLRSVYGAPSAWLGWAMLLTEPTLAAHLPLPTVDSLGTEGIILAAWAIWRYLGCPTRANRLAAAAAVALALLLKSTALVLLPVAVLLAAVCWLRPPRTAGPPAYPRGRTPEFAFAVATVSLFMWIFMLGDFAIPAFGSPFKPSSFFGHFFNTHAVPCGTYLKAVYGGFLHARLGHPAVLLGQVSATGWWYYFPVLATYKIPLGLGLIMVLGIASLAWVRPRYQEIPLLSCALAWTATLMLQRINIGFRHFRPAEICWLMLASRCVAAPCVVAPLRAVRALAWTGLAAAAVHVALWTPDYLSYINFPRRAAYLQISDSNIDWGQGVWQIRHWLDAHPTETRPLYVGYLGPRDLNLFDLLGQRLSAYVNSDSPWISRPGQVALRSSLPHGGILILSPVLVTGQYGTSRFAPFCSLPPEQTIGHCLLLYDLDRLYAQGKLP